MATNPKKARASKPVCIHGHGIADACSKCPRTKLTKKTNNETRRLEALYRHARNVYEYDRPMSSDDY